MVQLRTALYKVKDAIKEVKDTSVICMEEIVKKIVEIVVLG